VPNQLSRISHGELAIRVKAQLLDAILFTVGWYGPILEYLQKGYFENNIPKEKSHIIVKTRPYILYDKILYKLGPDSVLWQCLSFTKAIKILVELHEGPTRRHFGINTTTKKILTLGY
jgi:hypothetical protein